MIECFGILAHDGESYNGMEVFHPGAARGLRGKRS